MTSHHPYLCPPHEKKSRAHVHPTTVLPAPPPPGSESSPGPQGGPSMGHPPSSPIILGSPLPLDCLHSCGTKGRSFLSSPSPGLIYVDFRLPTTWGNGTATPTQAPVNSQSADDGTFEGLERNEEPLTVNEVKDASPLRLPFHHPRPQQLFLTT